MCKTAPALLTFRNEFNALAPGRGKASDGSCPSKAHSGQNPTSDHEPNDEGLSRAYDLDEKLGLPGLDPAKPLLPVVPILTADRRCKYVIYERRIYYPDGTSKSYNGVNAHDKHLHLSIKNQYVHDTSPWGVAAAFQATQENDLTPDEHTLLSEIHAHLYTNITESINAVRAAVQAKDDPKAFAVEVAKHLDGITSDEVETALRAVFADAGKAG
jgi:hypothetical protein